eukprot:Phypoly_transcript_19845.p1 GENE.Phypoly_transcript_19845~~Phypoly_transcript_19845.p1  ORF type:complete len:191 (+),score=48.45 Phypoly_transcript_19845:55-627(+)
MTSPDAQVRWTKIFSLLDANNSGSLEKQDGQTGMQFLEKSGYFTPVELGALNTAGTQIVEGFLTAGETTNGKMILVQFLATAQAYIIGKSFDTIPQWILEAVGQIFDVADRNRNGVISQEEFLAIVAGVAPTVSLNVARSGFQQIDGPLTKALAQQEAWTWLSSNQAEDEDSFLDLALQEKQTYLASNPQ